MGGLSGGLSMRLRHAVVACALAGCSPVSDNSNNIDAAVVVDTTAPMLTASAPANMSKNASVLTPISLFFDEPLDPSTVTAENVKVTFLPVSPSSSYFLDPDIFFTREDRVNLFGEQPILGTVSYEDAPPKISFVPSAPLPHGMRISIALDGVKDSADNALAATSVAFATSINSETKRFAFNSSTGAAGTWQEFGPDMNGRQFGRLLHNSPGPDGVWHTMDDVTSGRYDITQSEDGRFLQELRYSGTGPDGVFGTPDDVASDFTKYTYDPSRRLTDRYYTNSPGADSIFGTADDVPLEIQASSYDAMGRFDNTVYYYDPGNDDAWRTLDDRCSVYTEFEYNATGQKIRDVYKSCGNDTLPRTVDDTINQYKAYTYDANGLVTDITTYYDKGNDGVFFTTDDLAFARYSFVRNAKGIPEKMQYYVAPGPDQIWNTADDVAYNYEKYTLDEHGLVTVQDFYNDAGLDGMYGTADDVVTSYNVMTYDANGNRLEQTTYVRGPDGMTHTADNRRSTSSLFDAAH